MYIVTYLAVTSHWQLTLCKLKQALYLDCKKDKIVIWLANTGMVYMYVVTELCSVYLAIVQKHVTITSYLSSVECV